MSAETLEIVRSEYQAGKVAFECGQYRQSVEHFEKASALVERHTRFGGEVLIWLVTAYEAAGQRTEAIDLCQQLDKHPNIDTRKQSRRLLYILQAPQLKRPQEWLTQIPDLATLKDNESKTRLGNTPKPNPPRRQPLPEPVDLTQVNTKDNRFIWFALLAVLITLSGLVWLSF